MKSFLHFEWIDYELGNPGCLAQGVHFWQIRPSHVFAQYLNREESLRYEKIAHQEACGRLFRLTWIVFRRL